MTTVFSARNVALVIFLAVFVERQTTRREGHLQSSPFVLFRTSDVATERFLSLSSSSSSSSSSKAAATTTTPTEEILAVVTVGWQISSSNPSEQKRERERQTYLRRILENYRNVCDDTSLSFKRVTVAIAAYVDDEDVLTTFLVTSSGVVGNNTVLSVRTNGDWRIVEDKEGNGSVRMERMESKKEVNINQKKKKKKKKKKKSASSCEFAVNLELFGFREIDTKKSYMTPGDLSIRHRDIFLRRILADDDEYVNGDKVLFIVQEDDVFLDEKHVSLFLETSKITERMNDDREEEEIFYHPFFFDYEKDSNDIVYADWRVNAGVVQKLAWNNQTVFVSAKASGGGRSLMIRGRSRLRDLLFTNKSSSNSSKTVSELEEWLDPLAAHPGEFNLEIATNRWIERRVRAKRGDSSAEKKALFLLPLSGGGNRSLETLLESSGIWHASNTYVGRRKELIVSSSANKNQETLERLRLDELRQIFHSCLTENDENECFRCLQNMDAKAAEYRARVFVDFERGEEDDEDDEDDEDEKRKADRIHDDHENEHSHRPHRREKKTKKPTRRRVDVSFSCAAK